MEKYLISSKLSKNINSYSFSNGVVFLNGFFGRWQLLFNKKGGGLSVKNEFNTYCFFTKSGFCGFQGHFEKGFRGVMYGYFIRTNFVGVGYKVRRRKKFIVIRLGYNHRFGIQIPTSVYIFRGKKNKMIFFSFSLDVLKNIMFKFVGLRLPDVYGAKGVHYDKQNLLRKEKKKTRNR